MKHGQPGPRLRKAPMKLRNLAAALILHERIVTTVPKAKALQPWMDRIVDTARRHENTKADLAELRDLVFRPDEVLPKVQGPLLWRYRDSPSPAAAAAASRYRTQPTQTNTGVRPPGYTRLHLYGHRDEDAAPLAVIELRANPRDIVARLGMRYLPTLAEQLAALRAKIYRGEPVVLGDDAAAAPVEQLAVRPELAPRELSELRRRERGLLGRMRQFAAAVSDYGRATAIQAAYAEWAAAEGPRRQQAQLADVRAKLEAYRRTVGGTFNADEQRQMRLHGLEIDHVGRVIRECAPSGVYEPASGVREYAYWPVDPQIEILADRVLAESAGRVGGQGVLLV